MPETTTIVEIDFNEFLLSWLKKLTGDEYILYECVGHRYGHSRLARKTDVTAIYPPIGWLKWLFRPVGWFQEPSEYIDPELIAELHLAEVMAYDNDTSVGALIEVYDPDTFKLIEQIATEYEQRMAGDSREVSVSITHTIRFKKADYARPYQHLGDQPREEEPEYFEGLVDESPLEDEED